MSDLIEFEVQIDNQVDDSLMWNYRFTVPNDIASQLIDKDRRIIFRINGEEFPNHAALMPNGSGGFYIMVNKELRKKHKIEEGSTVQITIQKDTSKYGMYVPTCFEDICIQDPEGSAYFHNLTIGKQRTLLHLMGKPKSEAKQIEKTLIIFDYLKSAFGELDFKALNQAFKTSRFKQF